jgi:hypothetical protein
MSYTVIGQTLLVKNLSVWFRLEIDMHIYMISYIPLCGVLLFFIHLSVTIFASLSATNDSEEQCNAISLPFLSLLFPKAKKKKDECDQKKGEKKKEGNSTVNSLTFLSLVPVLFRRANNFYQLLQLCPTYKEILPQVTSAHIS